MIVKCDDCTVSFFSYFANFRKRRRTDEKMNNIIKKIEREIENQLDIKNEKNDFTTTNIEAILKV